MVNGRFAGFADVLRGWHSPQSRAGPPPPPSGPDRRGRPAAGTRSDPARLRRQVPGGGQAQRRRRHQQGHQGYSGGGFVDRYGAPGATTAFRVDVAKKGTYDVGLRYANGPHPFHGDKKISLYVNGDKVRQTVLPPTADWDTWATRSERLTLRKGVNTIAYRYDDGDDGHVNLDMIHLNRPGERIDLFDGGSLSQWQHTDGRAVEWPRTEGGSVEVCCGDIRTKRNFGDHRLHVEFRVPALPDDVTGQDRGNSGVYLQNRYEVLSVTGLFAVGHQAAGFEVLAVSYLVAVYGAVRAGHRAVALAASLGLLAVLHLTALVSRDGAVREVVAQARNTLELAWLIAAFAAGEAVRQAERRADEAERTREETARRRADEERLRIARGCTTRSPTRSRSSRCSPRSPSTWPGGGASRCRRPCWRSRRPAGRRAGSCARPSRLCATTTPPRRTDSTTSRTW
ncbi:hypothetical protein SGRIM128S_05051 [Streptomyces griseomycini]